MQYKKHLLWKKLISSRLFVVALLSSASNSIVENNIENSIVNIEIFKIMSLRGSCEMNFITYNSSVVALYLLTETKPADGYDNFL